MIEYYELKALDMADGK